MKKFSNDSVLLVALGCFVLLVILNSILAYRYFEEPYRPAVLQLQKSAENAAKIPLMAQIAIQNTAYTEQLIALQDSLKNNVSWLKNQKGGIAQLIKEDKTLSYLILDLQNLILESEKHINTISRNSRLTDEVSQVERTTALKKLRKSQEETIIILKQTQQYIAELEQNQKKQYRIIFFIFSIINLLIALFATWWVYNNYIKTTDFLAKKAKLLLQNEYSLQQLSFKPEQQPALYAIAELFQKTGLQLKEATQFAQAIGQGNFEYQLSQTEENTLAKALQEMKVQLKAIADAEKTRNWHIGGLAQLNELLRLKQQDGMQQFLYHFIVFLAKYIQAVQGSLYLKRQKENTDILQLMACYAFERQRFLKDEKPTDEGVLGQVFMSRKSLKIEQIPADYLKITSGLGKALPQSLLVVPIMDTELTFGVVEIASFKPFDEAQVAFTEAACQALATTLAVIERNEKNAILLQKAEQDNNAMKAQEEELRQNAEEMQAIQEELNRRLQALQEETNFNKCIIDAINKTNATVEFDTQGNITDVNSMYVSVMGYEKDEIVGSNELKYVPDDEKQSQRYEMMWESLRNGSYHAGEYRRISKEGKEVWLNGTYNPIFDIHGNVYKIIQFAQFTTEEKERELDLTSKINALSTTFPLVDIALNGALLSANPAFLTILNFKRNEIRGKKFIDFLYGDSSKFQEAFQQATEGKLQQIIITIKDGEGGNKYFISVMSPIRNLAGNIYKLMTILIDITEQKELELELIHNQQKLSGTIQELKIAQNDLNEQKIELETRINLLSKTAIIFEMNEKGVITETSNEFANFLETDNQNLLQKTAFDLIEGETKELLLEMIQTANNGYGLTMRNTLCYQTSKGNLKWGDTTIASVVNTEGKVSRMIAVMFDVTKQVLQETALRNSLAAERMKNLTLFKNSNLEKTKIEQILDELLSDDKVENELNVNAVINNNTIPTAVLDKKGNILLFNPLFENKLNSTAILQQDLFNYIYFENVAEKSIFKQKMLQGDMIETTVQLINDQEKTAVQLLTLPMFNTAGELEILVMLIS